MPLLKLIDPQPGQIFWDIGCGGAKPVAVAGLMYPELKICKGIEYLPNVYKIGKESIELLQKLVDSLDQPNNIKLPPFEI